MPRAEIKNQKASHVNMGQEINRLDSEVRKVEKQRDEERRAKETYMIRLEDANGKVRRLASNLKRERDEMTADE